ncbi:FadR/GntR family transcriptional regulator [Streptomyces sp. NPDC087908]|uniref:FadR/GntR family transcriptional regulator n=1 Tax=Streptomyces sp. NPDC087908 TaxID=3365820 RepID=UPI00382D144D
MSQSLTETARLSQDAVFRPVRTGNAFEETVERLLYAVKLGFIAQGQTLPPERDLAAQLQVSRVTLREAIRALQQSGHLESRRGRYGGTFVTYTPSEPDEGDLRRIADTMGDELADALAFRQIVEPGAAALTAERPLTAENRQFLQAHLDDVLGSDQATFRQADSRFHLAIAEMSGSPTLYASVAETRLRLDDLLNAIPLLERNIEHSHDQHHDILMAILRGDPETARSVMGAHVSGTAALLRGFLG